MKSIVDRQTFRVVGELSVSIPTACTFNTSGWNGDVSLTTRHTSAITLHKHNRLGSEMNRSLQLATQLDVIVQVGDKRVAHAQDARSVVIGVEPGSRVPIGILRNGKRATVDVQLASPPAPQPAR